MNIVLILIPFGAGSLIILPTLLYIEFLRTVAHVKSYVSKVT